MATKTESARVMAGERLDQAKEAVAEKASAARDAAADLARQVHIDEFHLRGGVGDHPFEVNLEDDGGRRYLAFDVTVRTEEGDFVRITGRKSVALAGGDGTPTAQGHDTVEATPASPAP